MNTEQNRLPVSSEAAKGNADRFLFGALILLMFAGFWTAREIGQRADRALRNEILLSAGRIARAIHPDRVRQLTFTATDTNNPAHLRLRTQMRAYAEAMGLRSLYSMALRDGKLVFGPESLDPNDPYASAPGTVYENPSPMDFEVFQTGQANVQGPRTDEYGSFVSALAPVIDPRTGEVLMAVGIDLETPMWKTAVRRTQLIVIEILILLFVVLAAGALAVRVRQRYTVRRHPLLIYAETAVCALILLIATVVAARLTHQAEERERTESFRFLAQARAAAYSQTFSYLRNELNMLSGFFKSSDHVSRSEFNSYCRPLVDSRLIQACLWIPSVSSAEINVFTDKTRAEELHGFSIWEPGPDGSPAPAAERDIHYPVLYVEPWDDHQRLTGYDMSSDPLRRSAIDAALQTGHPTASDPVTLFAAPGSPRGFVVFQPASNAGQTGTVGMGIVPDAIVQRRAHVSDNAEMTLSASLYHLAPGRPPLWLACSRGCSHLHDRAALRHATHESMPVFIFGQVFEVLIGPEPEWLATHPLRRWIATLITGGALTFLFSVLMGIAAGRQTRLEHAVWERTAELAKSQDRFSSLFRNLSSSFALHEMIYDPKGRPCDYRFLEVNPAFERMTGLKARNIIGRTVREVLPETEEVWFERYGRVALTGRPEQFEMFAASLNRHYSVMAYRPGPDQFATLFDDITDRRKAEEDMRRLQEIVTGSPNVAYLWRAEPGWPVEYISENVRQYGYSPEDFTGGRIRFDEVIHPDDFERVVRELEEYSADENLTEFKQEYRILAKDGRIHWVHDDTRILRDSSGRITHYQGLIVDITALRKAEAAHAESEERYRALIEAQADAVCRWLPDTTLTYVNHAYCEFYGRTREELLGSKWIERVAESAREEILSTYAELVADPKPFMYEHESVAADGSLCWQQWIDTPLFDKTGRLVEFQSVGRDITKRKHAEVELERHRQRLEELVQERTSELQTRVEEAERLNHAMANLLSDIQLAQARLEQSRQELQMSNETKARFLATMSHEMHTPLNSVIGFAEALEDGVYGTIDEQQREPLENIRESAQQLHRLINDLLNITRIEGGVMPFHADSLPIRQVLEECCMMLRAAARSRQQQLSADFRPVPDSLRLRGDVVKIKQIMHHLISNAIKFTPDGGRIDVSGDLVDGADFGLQGRALRVSVRDTGKGLTADELACVFGLFYQSESPLTRTQGGTGLGLPIAKEFIRLHGGRIWAESAGPGRGCVFTFVIPTQSCEPS